MFNYIAKLVLGLLSLLFDAFLILWLPMIRWWKYFNSEELDETVYKNKPNVRRGIILVHGSGVNECQFVYSRKIIDKLMHKTGKIYRVYSCDLNNYNPNKKEGIEIYAARLFDKIQRISNEVDEIVLIGHSMGGLVSAWCAEHYEVPVKKVITIATPWQGAPALNYIHGMPMFDTRRHLEMKPDSDVLKRLHKKVRNGNIQYITIGSTWEVQVPEGSYHMDHDNFINLNTYYGHTTIILMESTWKKLFKYL